MRFHDMTRNGSNLDHFDRVHLLDFAKKNVRIDVVNDRMSDDNRLITKY